MVIRSEMTSTKPYWRMMVGKGPNLKMATDSEGVVAGKDVMGLTLFTTLRWIFSHGVHSRTTVVMSVTIYGQ